ncbi:SDR family NAD(P)-dependent oxidoreductase [Chitinophaga vietnamensis]|uniref:SDR family NAD(P)-dependent oxidoreductase n=1 Tax=Chitinophaga vietnamensis TaxID=2593957 RepID=UPI0011788870|nr:SDR family oxidoreductase [Chitinophaga vietnamensis]
MNNRTAIITGASSGLGKAMALYFLEKGFNVVAGGTSETGLQAAFAATGMPAQLKLVAGDIREQATAKALVAAAVEHFGTVDVLINNAGIFQGKPFLEVEEADLDLFMDVNFKGTFFLTQAAIREMLQHGGGAVINIGTVLVDHAIGGFPATAPIASKAAIHALTRQLAAEFGPQNIRVNTIAPGVIRSPLQAKSSVDNPDALGVLSLLNRIGETEEISTLAWHLATSNFITGEIFRVDGGHTAGHHLRN